MDLAKLQKTLETAPADVKRLAEEIMARQKQARILEFLLEAVRLLRVSWKDSDPGKYTAHWYCFKDNRKVWPRELIERDKGGPKPDPSTLCDFERLDAVNCPGCRHLAPLVCRYQQTEDGPFGDTWTKTRYALCAGCRGLVEVDRRVSSHRF